MVLPHSLTVLTNREASLDYGLGKPSRNGSDGELYLRSGSDGAYLLTKQYIYFWLVYKDEQQRQSYARSEHSTCFFNLLGDIDDNLSLINLDMH